MHYSVNLYYRLGMNTVFENGRFGGRFHLSLSVLVGVLDSKTPTQFFLGVWDFSKTAGKRKN